MLEFVAMPTDQVKAYRSGAPDAFGPAPERTVSTGLGNPCRHCLKPVPKGAGMLVLAYKPFHSTQPYAEIGPVFLCADDGERGGGAGLPEILTTSPDDLIKGYSEDDRIFYGTGAVTPVAELEERLNVLLDRDDVAYIHVRSARNNCYQAGVNRRPA